MHVLTTRRLDRGGVRGAQFIVEPSSPALLVWSRAGRQELFCSLKKRPEGKQQSTATGNPT